MKRLLTQTLMSALLVTGFSLQAATTAPAGADFDFGAAINAGVKAISNTCSKTKNYISQNKMRCAVGTAMVAAVILLLPCTYDIQLISEQ